MIPYCYLFYCLGVEQGSTKSCMDYSHYSDKNTREYQLSIGIYNWYCGGQRGNCIILRLYGDKNFQS